jgi:hypothetical protein
VYDGSTAAEINSANVLLAGVVSGDSVRVSTQAAAGTFASKDVVLDASGRVSAQSVAVTGLGLSGSDAANYKIVATANTSAKVLQRQLTITGSVAQDKLGDGTVVAQVTPGQLGNLVSGESLKIAAAGQFDNAEPGPNKAVKTIYTLANTSNGLATNYSLPSQVLYASIVTSNPTVLLPKVSLEKAMVGIRRVTDMTRENQNAQAVTSQSRPLALETRDECSVINPAKCVCEVTAVPGVEMCFMGPTLSRNGD